MWMASKARWRESAGAVAWPAVGASLASDLVHGTATDHTLLTIVFTLGAVVAARTTRRWRAARRIVLGLIVAAPVMVNLVEASTHGESLAHALPSVVAAVLTAWLISIAAFADRLQATIITGCRALRPPDFAPVAAPAARTVRVHHRRLDPRSRRVPSAWRRRGPPTDATPPRPSSAFSVSHGLLVGT